MNNESLNFKKYRQVIDPFFPVGAPIDVKKNPNPTREEIEDLHTQYVEALKDLYERYRYKYSQYPDTDITITWIVFFIPQWFI